MYHLSKKSIRADTRPLFGSEGPVATQSSTESSPRLVSSPKSFAETLSQALDGTPQKRDLPATSQLKPLGSPYPPNQPFRSTRGPKPGLSKFGSPPSQPAEELQPDFSDDMDWTPTTSSHRAFQPQDSSAQIKPFGHAPVAPEQGPFWYKAPPMPQHPAHRLRNAPRMPVIQSQTVDNEPPTRLSFGRPALATGMDTSQGVTFSQPTFFAKDRGADEANSLADMFGGAFTVKDKADLDRGSDSHVARPGIFALGGEPDQRNQALAEQPNPKGIMEGAEPITMAFALLPTGAFVTLWLSWIFTSSGQLLQTNIAQPSILILAAALSTACLGILARRVRTGQLGKSVIPFIFISLRAAEAIGACWVVWQRLTGVEDLDGLGGGIICFMLGHQVVENAM